MYHLIRVQIVESDCELQQPTPDCRLFEHLSFLLVLIEQLSQIPICINTLLLWQYSIMMMMPLLDMNDYL